MSKNNAQAVSEPAFYEQTWDLAYRHALGQTVGSFFEGLRNKELWGRKCPDCERVIFPARSFCDRCHTATEEWVEVQSRGVLEMFTIVHEAFRGIDVESPYVLAYATLDGADTAVVGFVKGVDLTDSDKTAEKLKTGTPVDVVFAQQPQGRVTDFWFELRNA